MGDPPYAQLWFGVLASYQRHPAAAFGLAEGVHGRSSDPHWHYDVAVLVFFAFGGAHLAGGLGILEFELHVAAAGGLEEVQKILRVEADRDHVAVVVDLDRVFGLARLG